MQKGDMMKRTSKMSLKRIQAKLDICLATVGDMALKRRARRIVQELELRKGDSILDIGCGNGYYLSLLARLDSTLRLSGVDNDGRALSDAKKILKYNRIKLSLASAEKLPFRDQAFDKIIISEVIEHVVNESKILEEAYRVIKPGGIIALTTCNIDYPFLWDPVSWVLQHFLKTHIKSGFWAGIWNQHLRLYKKDEVERLVKNAKFDVELSESLTTWCLPFNHHIVNFIARLFYDNKLPKSISRGLNKFSNNDQSTFILYGYKVINLIDKLNDLLPQQNGVSVFIKARK